MTTSTSESVQEAKSARRKRFNRVAIVIEVVGALAIAGHALATGNTALAIGIVAIGAVVVYGYNLLSD